MGALLGDADLVDRIFTHIDARTTDKGTSVWREPTVNYTSPERFAAELEVMRRVPMVFCPSAALPEPGSYIARTSVGTPLLVVRGLDGVVRGFRNACRHRGMALAETGTGCKRALVCPYHSWTYGLDGKLRHIPGEAGFPGLDKEAHGLVPVTVQERGGLVFVTQDEPLSDGPLAEMPDLLSPDHVLFDNIEFTDHANWKLIGETSMEGYHIRHLHKDSFYPYGYDNLNVVELQGRNSRIVFPFRRIEKLRDQPRESWNVAGRVTDVYQLFPNAHFSFLSSHAMLVILEPVGPSETRWVIYQLAPKMKNGKPLDVEEAKRDARFVQNEGLVEDRQAACSVQASLAAGANTHFTFGHYEAAIGHFHRHLTEHVDML